MTIHTKAKHITSKFEPVIFNVVLRGPKNLIFLLALYSFLYLFFSLKPCNFRHIFKESLFVFIILSKVNYSTRARDNFLISDAGHHDGITLSRQFQFFIMV